MRLQHADRRALDAAALTFARVSSVPCRFCRVSFVVSIEPGFLSGQGREETQAPNQIKEM
jgi:hypothetical protein